MFGGPAVRAYQSMLKKLRVSSERKVAYIYQRWLMDVILERLEDLRRSWLYWGLTAGLGPEELWMVLQHLTLMVVAWVLLALARLETVRSYTYCCFLAVVVVAVAGAGVVTSALAFGLVSLVESPTLLLDSCVWACEGRRESLRAVRPPSMILSESMSADEPGGETHRNTTSSVPCLRLYLRGGGDDALASADALAFAT